MKNLNNFKRILIDNNISTKKQIKELIDWGIKNHVGELNGSDNPYYRHAWVSTAFLSPLNYYEMTEKDKIEFIILKKMLILRNILNEYQIEELITKL